MGKILVITGPTATGKTKLGVELAEKYNGEIISADSRQVYQGSDIETGKDKDLYQKAGVKVWGLDLVSQDHIFNVSEFARFAKASITDILRRGKLPIIVGGAGLYLKELLNPSETLHVKPSKKLREKLEKYLLQDLQKELRRVSRKRWEEMNESDKKNPRRLIRAIEIAQNRLKKNSSLEKKSSSYSTLVIGLTAPRDYLYEKIATRRQTRPDLVKKEFALAKKQLLYQRKYLPAIWFDITDRKYHDKIMTAVQDWYYGQKS